MKRQTFIILAGLGTVLFCLWLLRPGTITSSQQPKEAAISPARRLPPHQTAGEPQPGGPSYREYRFEQRQTDLLWDYRRPIQFYGQVVDKRGNPVAGLSVDFSWKDISPEGTSKSETATDIFGRFSLTGVSGKLLTIRLDDTEYNILSKPNQFGFEYANPHLPHFHLPNPNEPVIFLVQKKHESAPLITGRAKIAFSKGGQPTKVNLMTGEEASDGQFQVQVWAQDRDERGRYDWKVSLKMTQGGFLEAFEEFPSEAPLSGYETAMEFFAPASSPEWRPSLEKQLYYVVGSPPRYGRINLSVKVYAGRYYVDYFLNPTGGRNLVYDPLRDVEGL